jgi:hypothetical protein
MKNQVKVSSKTSKSVVFAAVLVSLITVGTGSAAAAADPVFRNLTAQTINGECCVPFNATVSISEPAVLKPVVVDWDTGYGIIVNDRYVAGLSVNGGACQTGVFGADVLPDLDTLVSDSNPNVHFQWIILPSDGVLVKGINTFAVCGGGASTGDSIAIFDNTLSVQLN